MVAPCYHYVHHDVPFAPLDLLVAVVPTFAFDFCGFHALAINNCGTGLGFATRLLAHGFTQGIVHSFPDTLSAPGFEVAVDGWPGGEFMGHHAPGATASQDIENGIDNLPHVHTSATTTSFVVARCYHWQVE